MIILEDYKLLESDLIRVGLLYLLLSWILLCFKLGAMQTIPNFCTSKTAFLTDSFYDIRIKNHYGVVVPVEQIYPKCHQHEPGSNKFLDVFHISVFINPLSYDCEFISKYVRFQWRASHMRIFSRRILVVFSHSFQMIY